MLPGITADIHALPYINHNKDRAVVPSPFGTPIPSPGVAALFQGVAATEMGGYGDPSLLFASEREQIRNARKTRVEEFAGGRGCARRALHKLGIKEFSLLICEDRRPNWPSEIVGSITHTKDFCAAAVARKNHCKAVGLDAENVCGITPDLYPYMCTPEEHGRLNSMNSIMGAKTAALIFCAKEAFYKCQYTITGEFLNFQDVQLDLGTLNFEEGRCRFLPTREIILTQHLAPPYEGRFYFRCNLIISGFQFV
jgi:4'-phosphopantetheinyl transferase EntD